MNFQDQPAEFLSCRNNVNVNEILMPAEVLSINSSIFFKIISVFLCQFKLEHLNYRINQLFEKNGTNKILKPNVAKRPHLIECKCSKVAEDAAGQRTVLAKNS